MQQLAQWHKNVPHLPPFPMHSNPLSNLPKPTVALLFMLIAEL